MTRATAGRSLSVRHMEAQVLEVGGTATDTSPRSIRIGKGVFNTPYAIWDRSVHDLEAARRKLRATDRRLWEARRPRACTPRRV
jgi:hypothetical protein